MGSGDPPSLVNSARSQLRSVGSHANQKASVVGGEGCPCFDKLGTNTVFLSPSG